MLPVQRSWQLIFAESAPHGAYIDCASSFGKQQESSLEDYVQLSVMMQYNYRESKTVSE